MLELIQKGGPLMWPLLVCSFISLTVIIERLLFWRHSARHHNQAKINQVIDLIEKGHFDEALKTTENTHDYILDIFRWGITHQALSLEKALEMAATQTLHRMRRLMGVLDTIITLAPLLGILGTVTGIIVSFGIMGDAGIDDPKLAMGGIAQAFITTAAGLIVAIITLIPHNYFVSRIEEAIAAIELHLTNFELSHQRMQKVAKHSTNHEG